MNIVALAVGCLTAVMVVRGLVIGSATAGGEGLRRDEEPLIYWSAMYGGAVIAGFLMYKGFA
jgi:hypothetical protein